MASLSLSFIDRSTRSIATALKGMDAEGYDLREVREVLDEIDKAHKERDEGKELQEAAAEAAKANRQPRRFIAAYKSNVGRKGTVQGTEFPNGYVYVQLTMSSPNEIDGGHTSMDNMKAKLNRANIAYYIEYID